MYYALPSLKILLEYIMQYKEANLLLEVSDLNQVRNCLFEYLIILIVYLLMYPHLLVHMKLYLL